MITPSEFLELRKRTRKSISLAVIIGFVLGTGVVLPFIASAPLSLISITALLLAVFVGRYVLKREKAVWENYVKRVRNKPELGRAASLSKFSEEKLGRFKNDH